METVPMFEEDWVQTMADAANGEGPFKEEPEPIETVIFEGPIQASQDDVPDDTLLDSQDIPATQVEDTPQKGEEIGHGEKTEGSKEDPGMVEGCEKGVESKRDGIVAPSPAHQPDKDEAEQFPLVTREQQQAFKEAKGQVSKMDELAQAPKKLKAKAKAKTRALKRPAASKKDPKPTKKPNKMAMPVETLDVEDDEYNGCSPINLEGVFEEVADSNDEGDANSTHADPPTPSKPAGRRKRTFKTKSPKTKVKKTHTKAKAKASPKGRVGKGKKAEKGAGSEGGRAGKASAGSKAEDGAGSKAEGGAGFEAEDGAGCKGFKIEDKGRKTFAGRPCPAKDPEAQMRFECLKHVFYRSIFPLISEKASTLEAPGVNFYRLHQNM